MNNTVIIMEAPDHVTSIEQLSDEHQFLLGAFGEVIGVLRQVFPDGDFSDPTGITIHRGENRITIDINKYTPVQNFIINSDKELPAEDILKLCKKTGWRALDTNTGLFLDQRTPKHTKRRKTWWRFWEN